MPGSKKGNVMEMRKFETGATRNDDTDRLDYEGFMCPRVLRAFAEFMHQNRIQADGKLRDSDNWQKGIPKDAYMKSMWRHFMEVWAMHTGDDISGDDFEVSLCALKFNVDGMLHEVLKDD